MRTFKGDGAMSALRNRATAPLRVVALAIAFGPMIGSTAPAAPASHVLIVKSDDLPQYRQPVDAFIAAHQGRVTTINLGGSKEDGIEQLKRAAAKEPIDAVFALGAQAAWLSRQVLPTAPLTFAMVIDWQRYGLGEGATGVAVELPVDALLARFKLLLPGLRRLGVIHSGHTSSASLASARTAAATLGIELHEEEVTYADGVAGAYRRMRSEIDALWMVPDPVVVTHDNFRYLAERTRHDGIPFLAFSENFVRAGALLSISPDYATMGSQAAVLVERALDHQIARTMIQAPIGSSLVINAETARTLGIDVDGTMLSLADKVIEEGD
jgi:ABC-type uncharacterized transport system substrate-binding protein